MKDSQRQLGLPITKVLAGGANPGGDQLGVRVQAQDGRDWLLLMPTRLGQPFIATLTAAIGEAHKELLARLGSEQAVLDYTGAVPFRPTGYSVAQGFDEDGRFIILRLNHEDSPVADVQLTPQQAAKLAQDLLREAETPPSPRQVQ